MMRIATLVFVIALPALAAAAPTIAGCPVFPANNYWNTPVDALPVHRLGRAVRISEDGLVRFLAARRRT